MRRRRGFTLIEILIVIGIILVLIGLVILGVGYMGSQAKSNATRVTLENLKSMLAELQATAGLTRQPSHMWQDGIGVVVPATDVWRDGLPNTAAMDPMPLPGRLTSDDPSRFNSAAVRNTQLVITLMASVPANRDALQKLPSQQRASMPNLAETFPGPSPPDPAPYDESAYPLVLDAWGGVILFVPSAGCVIAPDWSAGNDYFPGYYVTNGGNTFRCIAPAINGEATTNTSFWQPSPAPTSKAPDGRAFFLSSGPDGIAATPDDNLYSFDN